VAPSLALTPKACGCNREEALMASTSQVENATFFFTEKVTQLDRDEFLELFFVLEKAAFANSVRLFFFPTKSQLFNVRKTSYWIRSLLERSDTFPFGLQNSREKNKGVPLSEMLPP